MILDVRKHMRSLTKRISSAMKFPLAFAIVVEVLSSLQIFNITLNPTFAIDVTKTFTFSGWTWKVTLYAGTIDTTDSSISDYTIQIIWYVMMGYLILHLSAFILMLISQIKRITYKVDLFFRVMGIVYILHSRLLFFVLHYFFSGIIWSYVEYHDDDQMNSAFYYQQPFLAVTILACCVNIVIAFWIELSLYNVNKSKNDYAIQSNFFHQGVLLHKTVAIVFHFLFLTRGSVSIIEGIIHMLFTCSSIYTIYTRLPFYKTILLKIRIVLLALTLASSTILLVKEFSVKSIYLEVPWLMLSLLLIKVSLIALEILFKDILQGKFDTPEKAIHFAILIKQTNFGFISPAVHRRYFLNGTLLSSGFLKNQKVKLDSKNKDLKEYDRTVYKFLMNRLTLVLNKRRKSVPLVLFMAKIYLKKLENIPYVIGLLKKVNEQYLSTPLRNSVDEFSNTLERLYFDQHQSQKEKGDDELNLISYFKYRELAVSLKEDICTETKMHLELWQELKTEKIEVKKLMDLAYEIDKMYHQNSSRFYQNLPEFSKHIANSLLVYRAYTEVVREIPVEARKLMRKFITIRHNYVLRHPLDVYSDEKAVLVLSLQKDLVGNIIDASGSAQTFFQIDKAKFLGEQLTSLIPSVLIKSHLQFIQNYAKNLDQKMDYHFNTFAKTAEKDLFELSVHISLYPEIDKEPKLMMFCQKLAPPMPIIIVDNDGQIVEYSKSAKETLINEDINIGTRLRRISAEYDVINTAFNIVYHPNNAEQIEENKKLVKKRTTKSRSSQLSGSLVSVKHLINQNATKSSYDRESVDADRAVDICNNYISGSKLTFNATAKKPEMTYDIQIEPFPLEDQIFKVITLKYEENNNVQIVPQSPIGGVELEMENSEILTDIFPEDFPEADEGKFENINSPSKIHHLASKGQTVKQEGDTLMSRLTLGIPNERFDREMSLVTKSTLQRASLRGSESFTKGMKTITKSAELAEKPKVSLSVDEPQKALPVQHEMSVTSYATGSVEAIKALRLIFDQKSTYPLRMNSILVIGFLMICMIVLTVVFYIFSKNAIAEHDRNIQIINDAGERLAAGIKAWQYSIRYMLSQAGWSGEDLTSIESNIATTSLSMLTQGSGLSQLASQTLAQNRLEDIYQENIEFWEPCMNLRTNDKPLNTFVASDLLYNKFISYSEPLQTCTNINVTDNILYVVNNTGNDYLISSEELGTVTQGILDSNVSTSTLNLEIILIFESITLVALSLYLIYAVRSIVQSYKRLFRALLRLDVTQISNRVLQLQLALKSIEIDIEDTKFGADSFASIQEIKPSLKEFSKGKGKQQRQRFASSEDTFSVKILQIYIVKYVAGTLIFILIPIVLFYVSLLKSISNFGSLDYIDNQLSLTTKSEYNSRLLMNNFYLIMYFQNESSILIRNEPLMDQLTLNLDTINSLHSQMLSVFFENQNYSPDQTVLSMMTDTVCSFLPTTDSTVTENCPVATEGNTIGLLSMDANFISTSSIHITDYLNNPTAAYAIDQLDTYQSDVNALMITLEAAFSFLNTHILASAQTEITTFDNATTGLFVGILLAIFLAIIMINNLGIKTFFEVDMGRGKILKLIPYQILKDNKVLDAYLNKDFKKKKFAIK